LLMRFYEPDGGKIFIDGMDISRADVNSLRKCMTVVLQDTELLEGTIRENIAYGRPDAADADIMAAARAVKAEEFIRAMPDGYDTLIKSERSESQNGLSDGQSQLLAIARALLADAPVLLLDEATSYVDTLTEKLIQDALAAIMHGRTCIVIAHRLSTIKNADLILVMEDGAIIEQGGHDELMEKRGLYYSMYNSQIV